MKSLIPIFLTSLILAYFSDRNSLYEIDNYGCKSYVYKDKVMYIILTICMATFVGLRTKGNDTYAYRQIYEAMSSGMTAVAEIDWTDLSGAPGLQFVCAILRTVNATTQEYFMIVALFTVSVYLWFIRKYTSNIFLSVYYFITMGVYTFTMAAIKQTIAVAFLLIATDRAIEYKWKQFFFWVIIAELFHPYAFVYIIVPFLFFSPWSRKTYWLMGGTVIVAFGLERFMGTIFAMTDTLGYTNYEANSFSGEGVNIFRVAVVFVPVIISFLARNSLRKSKDRKNNLIINLTMVNAMIMFIGLFGTANYFARLANYFLIFQCLSLPWLFRFFNSESRTIVVPTSVIAFFGYFYYQTVLAQGAFDSTYSFISIIEFFQQLF